MVGAVSGPDHSLGVVAQQVTEALDHLCELDAVLAAAILGLGVLVGIIITMRRS